MKIFIRSIFKMTSPLIDKAPPLKWQSHSYILKRNGPEQTKLSAVSHWNQPIRRVALVFLWSDWLRDVWNLYSVAKSCCPLVVNKIYTQTSAVNTNTDPLWRETSHTNPLPGHSSYSGGWLPVYAGIYLLFLKSTSDQFNFVNNNTR